MYTYLRTYIHICIFNNSTKYVTFGRRGVAVAVTEGGMGAV